MYGSNSKKMPAPTQSGMDGEVTVSYQGNVAIVTMDRGENRFNPSFIDAINNALDEVESNPDVQVMITTGKGKFYSNGLDLNFLAPKMQGSESSDGEDFKKEWAVRASRLWIRVVEFPVITVAALNGHAFAAGAIFALAHDYRVMNNEKGWFCLNEVHIGLNFNPFAEELMRLHIPPGRIFMEAAVLGRRYTAEEAQADGITQEICSQSDLLETASRCGKKILPKTGFKRQFLHNVKKNVFGSRIRALEGKPALINIQYSSKL